ncbi:MAG: hypothetical protein JW955_07110 [Sedimentisphaerales bacterium]|nr:hypothetical protein [Sedimentisphaerales bacterium]
MTTVTIGMDLGDRKHQICVLDEAACKVAEVTIDNTATAIGKHFRKYAGAVVAVARKLAVLLHYLWKTGADYVALHKAGSPVA